MEQDLCHICGRTYTGDVCPDCGTPREQAEPAADFPESPKTPTEQDALRKRTAQAGASPQRKDKVKAPPAASTAAKAARAIRRCLWGMILFALFVSLLYARRNLADQELFAGNLERFAQSRSDAVYIWEDPEAASEFNSMSNLKANFPQFLQLAGTHFFNAIEEVGAIWSTH